MKYVTEKSKQAILDNFKQNSPNIYFDCVDYLAEECLKYDYDSLIIYYDEYDNCIEIVMNIHENKIYIDKWFDDNEYTISIYDEDNRNLMVSGSEENIRKYFENIS